MYEGIEQGDFMAALEAINGCPHIGETKQSLETICDKCRHAITSLVLLRDHYEKDPRWAEGEKRK